jgi:hypothetical protein
MRKAWAVAVALGMGAFTTTRAEEPEEDALRCEHFANGSLVTEVSNYPATLVFDTYIYNDSETQTFTVTSIYEWPSNATQGVVSIDVPPGTSIGGTTVFTLDSYAQCAALAGKEESAHGQPIRLKTFTQVRTATGEKARCVARVVCH